MDQQLLKACKPLVTNAFWGSLEDLLNEYIKTETQVLLNASDIGAVREYQGRIKAYKNLLSLPQQLQAIKH